MTKSEIIARLQNGETMDDIAAEISAMMTEAEDEYTAIEKAEAEKKARAAEASKKEAEKLLAAEEIASALRFFLDTYYPEADIEGLPTSGHEVVKYVDTTIQLQESIKKMAEDIMSTPDEFVNCRKSPKFSLFNLL